MLFLLDVLFTLLHFTIIGFNLVGWIWPASRRTHLVVVTLTALSWFGLGIWYGWGYCPITDWHWQVKRALGETNLPYSFIDYYAEKVARRPVSDTLVNLFTVITFVLVAVISIYLNLIRHPIKHR